MTNWKKIAPLAALTTFSIFGSAAPAAQPGTLTVIGEQPTEDFRTAAVSHGDLDLSSPADVKLLKSRVGRAIREVCSPMDQRHMVAKYIGCRSFARQSAAPQVDRAIARAQQLASLGTSSIAPVTIVIATPRN